MGLDLELVNTGVVILTEDGHLLRSGTIVKPLVSKKYHKITERDRIYRILEIANDIVGNVKKFKIQHIAIEGGGASFKGTGKGRQKSNVFQRGGLAYVVMTQVFLACKLLPRVVAANSARKVVLGYGKPSKEDVEWVLWRNGVEVGTGHEADAYVVARWMFDKVKKRVGIP